MWLTCTAGSSAAPPASTACSARSMSPAPASFVRNPRAPARSASSTDRSSASGPLVQLEGAQLVAEQEGSPSGALGGRPVDAGGRGSGRPRPLGGGRPDRLAGQLPLAAAMAPLPIQRSYRLLPAARHRPVAAAAGVIRGTGGNTTVPSVAAASMDPVRTAGKDRSVAGPDAVSGARRLVVGLSWAAAAWGLAYAAYRGYYALGGTGFLPGTPVPGGPFRRINAAAA